MSLTGNTQKSQVVIFTVTGTWSEPQKVAWDRALRDLKQAFQDRLTATWIDSAPPSKEGHTAENPAPGGGT